MNTGHWTEKQHRDFEAFERDDSWTEYTSQYLEKYRAMGNCLGAIAAHTAGIIDRSIFENIETIILNSTADNNVLFNVVQDAIVSASRENYGYPTGGNLALLICTCTAKDIRKFFDCGEIFGYYEPARDNTELWQFVRIACHWTIKDYGNGIEPEFYKQEGKR